MKSVAALAASLAEDPFYQAITIEAGSSSQRTSVLEKYFEYSLLEAQRTGRCVVASADAGAAAWLLPRTAEVQVRESKEKAAFMAGLLGPRGAANYHSIINFMSPLAEQHVPPEAWYLSIVGVHPAAQGKGLGRQLLTPTLGEVDALGVVAYLETFSAQNLAFYERLGFHAVASYAEPVTGASYTLMRRDT